MTKQDGTVITRKYHLSGMECSARTSWPTRGQKVAVVRAKNYALNIIRRSRMSTVEKKLLARTPDLPLFVQLVDYYEAKVSCGFKQFTSMH
jgi:Trm5-related predicted tRNA methylase